MAIVVVIPSRGRPERAREAIEAIRDTAALVDTSVILAVDANDPACQDYQRLAFPGFGPAVTTVILTDDETGNLVKATNTVSMRVARENPDTIIANFGDDHLARTPGFDKLVTEAMPRPGIVYGNDLIHGERLPSAPFISGVIVNALGWYALPTCHHLYIDDAWRELGKRARILTYLPEMVVEHMHPAVHKGEWDDGYERANNQAAMLRDREAFNVWRLTWLNADVINVQAALNVWRGQRTVYPDRHR